MDPNEVLSALFRSDAISRADLARNLRLSKAAITNLVQDLASLGVIEDEIPTLSKKGRNVMGFKLDLQQYFMVAVRINRTQLTARIYDGNGQALAEDQRPVSKDINITQLIAQLESLINGLIAGRSPEHFLGISMATLGWIFEDRGKITLYTDGFTELSKVDVRTEVAKVFPTVPVLLEHDAKTSALAEYADYITANGKPPACLLNIIGGIGFGGGIIVDGKIFRGSRGVAGEVGHMGINFNSSVLSRDPETVDYRGLFEDYASPRALQEQVALRLVEFPDTRLNEDSTPAEIFAAFEDGDALAIWAVDRVCRFIAYGLTGLVFVLNPDVIIFGDRIPNSAALLKRIHKYLAQYLPKVLLESTQVRVSEKGEESILFGAYLLLLQWYLDNGMLYSTLVTNGHGNDAASQSMQADNS